MHRVELDFVDRWNRGELAEVPEGVVWIEMMTRKKSWVVNLAEARLQELVKKRWTLKEVKFLKHYSMQREWDSFQLKYRFFYKKTPYFVGG